jgi:hypothetical protein
MKKNILYTLMPAVALILGSLGLASCGDPSPTDFIPQYVVQGYLIVGEPIRNIIVSTSQSVTDSFKLAKGAVTDAEVTITVGGRELKLQYRPNDGAGEYYYPDTTELVKPMTAYSLRVTLKDGAVLTGQTSTPGTIQWVQPPRDTVQYPSDDSLNVVLPDSFRLRWSAADGVTEYPLSSRCLDTVEYGKYRNGETAEKNLRIEREFDKNDPHYADVTRWGFLQGTTTPISWAAFKWYGLHEIAVWAPDRNFLNWFKFTQFGQNQQYDPLMGSIKGGVGVFGSASVIRKNVFVRKGNS